MKSKKWTARTWALHSGKTKWGLYLVHLRERQGNKIKLSNSPVPQGHACSETCFSNSTELFNTFCSLVSYWGHLPSLLSPRLLSHNETCYSHEIRCKGAGLTRDPQCQIAGVSMRWYQCLQAINEGRENVSWGTLKSEQCPALVTP